MKVRAADPSTLVIPAKAGIQRDRQTGFPLSRERRC
jgi:hypothetical protein